MWGEVKGPRGWDCGRGTRRVEEGLGGWERVWEGGSGARRVGEGLGWWERG